MRNRWSEDARSDIKELVAYVAENDLVRAKRLVDQIKNALRKASRFPRIGRVVPEFDDHDLREFIVPPYRVIYKLRGDLQVARVWHSSLLLEGHSISGEDG